MNNALKFLLANSLAFVLTAPLQLAVAEHHEEEKSKTIPGWERTPYGVQGQHDGR